MQDEDIPSSRKNLAILLGVINGRIELNETENYLRNYPNKKTTDYRKLLYVYDYKKYALVELTASN